MLWNLEHRIHNGVPTGFPKLDDVFGGFSPRHLSVLAARTSRGKTAFATNVALNAAKAGAPVAFLLLK